MRKQSIQNNTKIKTHGRPSFCGPRPPQNRGRRNGDSHQPALRRPRTTPTELLPNAYAFILGRGSSTLHQTKSSVPVLRCLARVRPATGSPMPVVCKWQNCLLVGSIAWVALNFYLAERLNDLLLQPTAGGSASSLDSPGVFSNGNEDEGRRPGGKPRRKTTQSAPANHIHSSSHYSFNRGLADDAMARLGRESIFQPLRAYVEKKLNDTVPGTVDKGNLDERKPKIQAGRPGKWYVPLPLREGSPDDVSST